MRLFLFLFILFSNSLIAEDLGVIAMFRNEAPYLKEWIEYHKLVGVQHFWLYDDGSNDGSQMVLEPYIQEGLVELHGVDRLQKQDQGTANEIFGAYVKRQCSVYQRGLKAAKERKVAWVALIDVDEFLVPTKDKNVTDCLKNHFSEAAAIYVNWRNFGTGGVFVPSGEPFLFRLVACSFKNHPRNHVGKSIVRPEAVEVEAIWYPHHVPLKNGCCYMHGDQGRMQSQGRDLLPDSQHHNKYLQINHYFLRDENYYKTVKVPRASLWYGDMQLLQEHYESFSKVTDKTLVNMLKKHHKEACQKIWKE